MLDQESLDPKENRAPNLLFRSKHEFTVLEKKIFYLIIDNLNPKWEASKDIFSDNIVIKLHNIRTIIGNPNFKNFIETIDLITTKRIRYVDSTNKVYSSITPFPIVIYKNGTLEVTILSNVIPQLTDLKNSGYTRYMLNIALSLSSQHSQRMYEILSSWKIKKEFYNEWTVEIDKLKTWLNVDTVKTYDKYAQFKRGVLNVAKKELGSKTDIDFDFEVSKKKGRKVTKLLFKVKYSLEQEIINKKDKVDNVINDARVKGCLEYLDQIGIVREDLRDKILMQLNNFYKWKYDLKIEKFKITKSIAGHLLKTLGLI